MAQGLLGGVLPAIYSGADQLKRGVYGLLTNPQEQAQRAAQSLLQSRAERQALMGQAFANPERPFQVTNQAALGQLGSDVLTGELGIAPIGMIAYHGTPHNIVGKFDINKVGTGEGAQNYGHGMYFAEAPTVAETYKKAGTGLEIKYNKPLEELGINADIATKNMDFSDPLNQGLGRIAKRLRTTALDYPDIPLSKNLVKEHFDEYIRLLDDKYPQDAAQKKALQNLVSKEGYPDIGFGGNLYKVDIPDEQIPKMLDWDKSFDEQTPYIQKIIKEIDPTVTAEETGREIYTSLSRPSRFKPNSPMNQFLSENKDLSPQAAASKFLYEKGILGNKYENFQIKKGQGANTSNYVVFDPVDVKILERNDKPVEGLLD